MKQKTFSFYKTFAVISTLSSVVVLSACGGGTTSTAAETYTYKGTVPGTLIEAFCDSGAYYSVTSVQNGTSQHPFEIELPANLACNLVMTTNENDPVNAVVTPIGFTDANGVVSTRASAGAGVIVDLGFVALHTDRISAAGFDVDGNGVLDTPTGLGQPASLAVKLSGSTTLDPDGNGIIEPYDDEDGDGIINRDDTDYSRHAVDRDHDGLNDDIDVNPGNDPDSANVYPSYLDNDGDGYLDDDRDHDGYHDDDLDRDGYHDDDLDHDSFHDDDLDHDGNHDQ